MLHLLFLCIGYLDLLFLLDQLGKFALDFFQFLLQILLLFLRGFTKLLEYLLDFFIFIFYVKSDLF